jgi:hypothetical protein
VAELARQHTDEGTFLRVQHGKMRVHIWSRNRVARCPGSFVQRQSIAGCSHAGNRIQDLLDYPRDNREAA